MQIEFTGAQLKRLTSERRDTFFPEKDRREGGNH